MNNQGGNNKSNLNGESPSAIQTKNTNQGIPQGIVPEQKKQKKFVPRILKQQHTLSLSKDNVKTVNVVIDMENGGICFGHKRSSILIANMLKNLPIFLQYEGYRNLTNINVMIAFNDANFNRSFFDEKDQRHHQPIFSDLDRANRNIHYSKPYIVEDPITKQISNKNFGLCSIIDPQLKLLYV